MLDGATGGGPFGLVVIMREGVASWMAHASACPPTLGSGGANESAGELVADVVRNDMVAVLASMIMTTHQERCT